MYTTCLHCHRPLGANDVIEHFQVGKRLAYDAAKGRLWVVCPTCKRWNLTPLEERWEAIDECEREFEKTSMRVSTDTIVLARTRGGLDLVRIGAPTYPEFAAWRYGRILRGRWIRTAVPGAIFMETVYGAQILGQANLLPFYLAFGGIAGVAGLMALGFRNEQRAKVVMPDGRVTVVKHLSNDGVVIEPDGNDRWALRLTDEQGTVRAAGPDAVRAMRTVLTSINFSGGLKRDIDDAAKLVGALGSKGDAVAKIARAAGRHANGNPNFMPPEARLGLEMALHEDSERAALEGELDALREEWRVADEIAQIADSMFVPESVKAMLARLRDSGGRR